MRLPATPYPCDERLEARIGKSPYVRFDLNDDSVPHTFVRKTVVVRANDLKVRVIAGDEIIAEHPRSYDRGAQIEEVAHFERLAREKATARRHRGLDRLQRSVPKSAELLEILAQRKQPLGRAVSELLDLLDRDPDLWEVPSNRPDHGDAKQVLPPPASPEEPECEHDE